MKKVLLITAAVAVVITGCIIVALSLTKNQAISIKDNSGNEIAKVEFNYGVKVLCKDEAYKDYVEYCLDSCQKALDKDNLKNVTTIDTFFDIDIFTKVYNATKAKQSEEEYISVSITDLEGRVVTAYGDDETQNRVMTKTYPGSALKPLSVYAPAIDSGFINWSSCFYDSPFKTVQGEDGSEQDWPVNAGNTYTFNKMTVCQALKTSTNTIAVDILDRYGCRNSMNFLEEKLHMDLSEEKNIAFINGEEEVYGNIALGYLRGGVANVEMAGYYQIFANGGKYYYPTPIKTVYEGNNKVYEYNPNGEQVISEQTAAIMNKLLQEVFTQGGTAEIAAVDGIPLGGKTGTTDGFLNNWLVGFSPEYSCAVWCGSDDNVLASGTDSAKLVFKQIFESLGAVTKEYPSCEGIQEYQYCTYSGMLKSSNCANTALGYYTAENIPKFCNKNK